MKEIFEAFAARIKSPVFGYFVLSWMTFNWRALFYLFFSETIVEDKFLHFDKFTNWYSLVLFPILVATIIALISPWINYVFLFLCKKPIDLKNYLQAESESKLLLKKKQLEEARSNFLATKEKDLIERAKRDEEVQSISDEETKVKLQKEIENLRKKISSDDNMTENSVNNINSKARLAHSFKQMAELLSKKGMLEEAEQYLKQAIQMEYEIQNN